MPYEIDCINFRQYNDLLRNEKSDYGEQIFFLLIKGSEDILYNKWDIGEYGHMKIFSSV